MKVQLIAIVSSFWSLIGILIKLIVGWGDLFGWKRFYTHKTKIKLITEPKVQNHWTKLLLVTLFNTLFSFEANKNTNPIKWWNSHSSLSNTLVFRLVFTLKTHHESKQSHKIVKPLISTTCTKRSIRLRIEIGHR
jgi:hypothetical protein